VEQEKSRIVVSDLGCWLNSREGTKTLTLALLGVHLNADSSVPAVTGVDL